MIPIIFEYALPVGKLCIYNERPPLDFAEVSQVHGNTVLNTQMVKDGPREADGLYCLLEKPEAMGIKTADCLPIWVCGEKGVALIHSGWKGVSLNIFSPENLKEISPFYFYIGPAIAVENYEVQKDFIDHFKHLEECFIHQDQRIYFDLKLAARILIHQQFPAAKIETSDLDTYSNPKLHSYRKNKTRERNWNLWIP